MKKLLLILTLIVFGAFHVQGFAQEEQIWEFEKAVKTSSTTELKANSDTMMAYLQDGQQTEQGQEGERQEGQEGEQQEGEQQEGEQQEGESQEGETQEGEMGESESRLPVQPLPLEDEEARDESTRLETPPSFYSIQKPEGSVKEENRIPILPTLEEKKADEEESVLSFNFLYMLIQKFKLSDIMED